MKFNTKAIHSGCQPDPKTGASCTPIYQTASFTHEDPESLAEAFSGKKFGYLYSRIANPNEISLEQKVTALENGVGSLAFGTGMAAIHAALYTLAESGDQFISSSSLFGGTQSLFEDAKRFGIEPVYVTATDTQAYQAALSPKTRFIFLECIGNPKTDVPDIVAIASIAKSAGVPLIVDGTLASPVLLNAKALGVNLVVHSATKYFGLGGSTLGGTLTDLGNFDWKTCKSTGVKNAATQMGPNAFLGKARKLMITNAGTGISPFSAFMLSLGIETLSLRVEKHCQNALELAQFFAKHPKIKGVNYPGLPTHTQHEIAKAQFKNRFGALMTIRLEDKESCYQMIKALKLVKNQANLGDSKTLVIHPESTIYRDWTPENQERAGVFPNLIRISVGLEDCEDLINDFDQALQRSSI
jgi:O-acetylhomoserine (thiol)-lyase